ALKVERSWETRYDSELNQTFRQAKQVPVLINYSIGEKRFDKKTDAEDLDLISKIEECEILYPFPTNQISKGDKTSDPFKLGINHVHQYYTRRNLWSMSYLYSQIRSVRDY